MCTVKHEYFWISMFLTMHNYTISRQNSLPRWYFCNNLGKYIHVFLKEIQCTNFNICRGWFRWYFRNNLGKYIFLKRNTMYKFQKLQEMVFMGKKCLHTLRKSTIWSAEWPWTLMTNLSWLQDWPVFLCHLPWSLRGP